ncbi:TIGR02679 family protein [bacterium 1XD42-94]|jgi:uncharacterized protein (TIGR02679 family)|nr:TIGR02679 family protein [bacterium 1XD42-76]NBK03591.1 TIGR02679 family protein [bacterium 1XD42-94]
MRECWMNNKEECAAYFKSRPEYERIFTAMRKKWESLGRTAGKVVLDSASLKEKKALERFLGISPPEGQIVFSLPEFEQAVSETRYGAIPLKELLEAYFGEPLTGSQEKRQAAKSREQAFWDTLSEEAKKSGTGKGGAAETESEGTEASAWIQEMRDTKRCGYAAVMKEYRKSEESACRMVLSACRCLALCRQESGRGYGLYPPGIRLAVLAAKVTGNPHALDRQNTAGTLLSYALCRRDNSDFPLNARAWKELYEKNGIVIDELSSTVAAYGIHLLTDTGLHPAYEGYWQRREPCVISLANLNQVRAASGGTKEIYIVENEMVFSELCGQLFEYPAALLCTSGQPRTAAYKLLKLLSESGHSFYYSGDLDPEGLDIAERIWRCFPERVCIWRMSETDYGKAMSEETISERRLGILHNITHPELKKTAGQIVRYKKAGYQELLLEEMAEDMKKGAVIYEKGNDTGD